MESTINILIVDEFESTLMNDLREANIAFDYAPYMDRKQILECVENYQGLIIRSKTDIDKEVIDKGSKLLFIARGGSGMDNVDEAFANKNHIKCINAPEGNRNAVAEHSIGLILNLFTKATKAHNEICANKWEREANRGIELSGKTVGIIGHGNVGGVLAKKLHALGCTVLAYDKYKTGFGSGAVKEVSLEELKNKATVISLHVPLTDETKYMVDTDFIKDVSNPFYLINTCRGKVVKLNAVLEGISANKILGFATDVLENENINKLNKEEEMIFKNLKKCSNTLFTPHIAGWTKESYIGISAVLASKIIEMLMNSEFFAKEILINLKN